MQVDYRFDKNKNYLAINLSTELLKYKHKPVFLCVGCDRVVGDCVGVIVGELLTRQYNINAYVYGNLDNPITAENLCETVESIRKNHSDSPIILVDAVLGKMDEIGLVKYYNQGAIPSGQFNEGVLVGDYSILGVVSTKGIDGLTFLNSVKLKTSLGLAKFIAEGISLAIKFCNNMI